jgi:hydroxypyruvate isomerase
MSLFSRREALKTAGGALALAGAASLLDPNKAAAQAAAANANTAPAAPNAKIVTKGRLQQSVCHWCFDNMSVEALAIEGARIGLRGIDLVGPEHFATLKKHGIIGTMTPSHGLTKGLNHKENHEECLKAIRNSIDATAAAGFPNVICFSGNRNGISEEEGLKNCAEALKQVAPYAEQKGVTICMELLNSKRNHGDYQCDRTHWGAKLVDAVGSPRFKLLYDIYHMQVQEGDVIDTIKQFKDHIGHYHTAGVPGRRDIDADSQELSYPPIVSAIFDTGFKGYFAHEFSPRNGIASLEQAAKICDL